MTIQLSDCCKVPVKFHKGKERPECWTCSKCSRVIGTPIEEPTEEKHTDGICQACRPKDTCEEEWEKTVDDATKYGIESLLEPMSKTGAEVLKKFIRSLISEKEATAREEERDKLLTRILKHKQGVSDRLPDVEVVLVSAIQNVFSDNN